MATPYEMAIKEEQKNWIPIQQGMIRNMLIRTCTNCENWDQSKDICKKFETLPPPKIIVVGCEDWEYLVPF